MEKLEIKNSITINAPIEKVWDALVNPAQTKKYMFGCETVSDWKVGSNLSWQAFYEGKNTVFVTGKIVSIEPANAEVKKLMVKIRGSCCQSEQVLR